MTDEKRFWHCVPMREEGKCWNWDGGFWDNGYPRFGINNKRVPAYRFAYELINGPIQDGMVVRHTCDNPKCVNPAHLLLGTQTENIQDRQDRGRQARGEKQGKAKLTEEQVQEIKCKISNGVTLEAIGKEYGVAGVTISAIKHGRSWRHVSPCGENL